MQEQGTGRSGTVRSLARFTESEREAIDYLRSEIEWHRKAGRYLFTISVGGLAGTAALIREFSSWGPVELFSLSIPVLALGGGAVAFVIYYLRIATQKSVTQSLIAFRLTVEEFRRRWWKAFMKFRAGRPELPDKTVLDFGEEPTKQQP